MIRLELLPFESYENNLNKYLQVDFMAPMVWQWTRGNSRVFTRDAQKAARAKRKGLLVSVVPWKTRVFKK